MNILMAGVGGQGLILVAKVLGDACIATNNHCVTAEVHGMAQRGGMITCLVRIGDHQGPLMPTGAADVLLGFEPLEALRSQSMLSERTTVVLNTNRIMPFTVTMGQDKFPSLETIVAEFKNITERVHTLDGSALAEKAGTPQALNIVLLGALAKTGLLPFSKEVLVKAITKNVPPKTKDLNLKAFELGYGAV